MNILVISAHPDDDVLGCGGSMAKWKSEGHKVHVFILAEGITSRDNKRDRSIHMSSLLKIKNAAIEALSILGGESVEMLELPDNRMDSIDMLDIVKAIELKIDNISPEMVFTHHSGDLNIDHRIVHQAVVTACRPIPSLCVKTTFF